MPKRPLDLSPGSLLLTGIGVLGACVLAFVALIALVLMARHFDDLLLAVLLLGPVVAVLALVLRK